MTPLMAWTAVSMIMLCSITMRDGAGDTHHDGAVGDIPDTGLEMLDDLIGGEAVYKAGDNAHAQEEGGDLTDIPTQLHDAVDQEDKPGDHDSEDDLLAASDLLHLGEVDAVAPLCQFGLIHHAGLWVEADLLPYRIT